MPAGPMKRQLALVRDELKAEPADLFFFLPAEGGAKVETRKEAERLERMLNWNSRLWGRCEVDRAAEQGGGLVLAAGQGNGVPAIHASLLGVRSLGKTLPGTLAGELPNEARVEMVRIGGDREAQKPDRGDARQIDQRDLRRDRRAAHSAG